MTDEKLLILSVVILTVISIAFVTLSIILLKKVFELQKKYNAFMNCADGETLESSFLARYKEIDRVKKETKFNAEKLNVACETLVNAFQKIGIVNFDATPDMTGKQSFALCLLNDSDSGFILTSVQTKDRNKTNLKEIIRGNSYVVMTNEERKALETAQKKIY